MYFEQHVVMGEAIECGAATLVVLRMSIRAGTQNHTKQPPLPKEKEGE